MSTKKILLVDDDRDLLQGMNVSLRASGYQVINAQDAIAAVSMARQAEPDLIVLDIGLPGGDGFQVIEWLKNLPVLTPVIVLSAKDAEPNRERALKRGAQAFFQKPVNRKVFMAAVRKALNEPAEAEADPVVERF